METGADESLFLTMATEIFDQPKPHIVKINTAFPKLDFDRNLYDF